MKRNVKLKAAIWKTGKPQKRVAMEAAVNQTYLSLALNGRFVLNGQEKERIARVLNKSPEELFDE